MADTLKLVKTYDFQADAASVDLFDVSTDRIEVAYEGWTPAKSKPNKAGRLVETITVRIAGTTTAQIAGAVQKISAMEYQAERFAAGPVEDSAVWLRVQLDGETAARQSLVYAIDHGPASSVYSVPFRTAHRANDYVIALERAPWWEGTAPVTINGTPSQWGGSFAYSGVTGDLPARIGLVGVANASSTGVYWPYGRVWMGFRGTVYGTPSTWVARKTMAELGTIFSTGTRGLAKFGTTSAYAVGGTVYHDGGSIFAAGTGVMQRLGMVLISDIAGSATTNAMYGSFKVFARMALQKSTADLVSWDSDRYVHYNVQLQTGYSVTGSGYTPKYTGYGRTYPRVPLTRGAAGVSVTNRAGWWVLELGEVTYPPDGRTPAGGVNASNFTIAINAEFVGTNLGAGTVPTVAIDSLYFIPTGEGFVYAGESSVQEYYAGPGGTAVTLWMENGPNEHSLSVISGTSIRNSNWRPQLNGTSEWALGAARPYYAGGMTAGSGLVFVLADDVPTPYLDGGAYGPLNTLLVDMHIFPRWQSLRGTA